MNLAPRLCFALLMTASAAAFAAGTADSVQVVDPYVRLIPPGAKATAAFMTLKNNGNADATLVKAESAAAKSVELHSHVDKGGVMEMRQVSAIDIKAKGETALQPGSYHIMMIDPVAMKEGDKVTLTLRFADGSSKQVEAPVKKPQAASMSMPMMDHSQMH
ncbi:MAG: copper chaperone PCu(A)C [Rhodocyclaceae bacterium]|nr:copper chaperone PCu(A)C [Rhodocyclaceae bacterium]